MEYVYYFCLFKCKWTLIRFENTIWAVCFRILLKAKLYAVSSDWVLRQSKNRAFETLVRVEGCHLVTGLNWTDTCFTQLFFCSLLFRLSLIGCHPISLPLLCWIALLVAASSHMYWLWLPSRDAIKIEKPSQP